MRALIPLTPPKLLSGLTAAQKKLILQSAELRKIRADRVIFRTGDPATSLFLLKQGRAKYYRVTKKGEEVVLWWLTEGDAFGLGTLLAVPINYIGTAQAIDDSELLVWSRNRIRSLAEKNRVLAQNALHIVLHCLATYTDRLIGLATGTAEERLGYTLLQLARRAGQIRSNGVELTILNEQLARLANVSAFTASRQLKEWERQGILQKSRGRIFIISPERLLIE
jgi:CRP/FNR family transcriptional regulator, nitrogen oxide reductase regulator